MSLFYLSAAALNLIALAFVLRPLLRRPEGAVTPAREATNLAILRDQWAELENDKQADILSEDQFAQAHTELERRVLEEAAPVGTEPKRTSPAPALAAGLAVLVVAGSVGLYLRLGTPEAILAQSDPHSTTADFSPQQIETMVAQLAQRMEEHPEDAKGWAILARSYYAMGRYKEAADAYSRLAQVEEPNADMLADHADALAMEQGRDLRGRPMELLTQALRLEPTHWKALMLVGTEAFEREDYRSAVRHWETLLQSLPPDSEFAGQIRAGIGQARAQAKQAGIDIPVAKSESKSTTAQVVQGRVRLSSELAALVSPNDTVFVFARAPGSKMPLAAQRFKAKDLPATFKLGDAQAMNPAARISQQSSVVVGARIAKSGGPVAQSGDLEGFSATVKPGARDVDVLIDRRVP
ncbi:MAG TPA: c-type cytochrome biogenesis protein CcmI [Burkholderiales bacterium]|jgi:cytochrome c-type biogenesis protein CcmH|nr:c-type cytochrome biogenesis protein CcmI [Burkholderiales bacterium]